MDTFSKLIKLLRPPQGAKGPDSISLFIRAGQENPAWKKKSPSLLYCQ